MATETWPPFIMQGPDGAWQGLDATLLDAVGERLGVSFAWAEYPWARCLLNMRTGVSDLVTSVARSPEREAYMRFTTRPYASGRPAFFVKKGRGAAIRTYADLAGLDIGYTRDSVYFEPFDSDESLAKFDLDDEVQLIRMVDAGSLDALVGMAAQVRYDLERLGLEDALEETAYRPADRIELFIGVSKRSPLAARMPDIDAALDELLDQGLARRLHNRYFD